MLEFERTFLVRSMPEALDECERDDVVDTYFPSCDDHPTLRLRRSGADHEITRKVVSSDDHGVRALREETIPLSAAEYAELSRAGGKSLHRIRYRCGYGGITGQVDVFLGPLFGLVIAQFEFGTAAERDAFGMPEFCLADITYDERLAGGRLAGRAFDDLAADLGAYGYQRLIGANTEGAGVTRAMADTGSAPCP